MFYPRFLLFMSIKLWIGFFAIIKCSGTSVCHLFALITPTIKIMNLRLELHEKFSQLSKTSRLWHSHEFAHTTLLLVYTRQFRNYLLPLICKFSISHLEEMARISLYKYMTLSYSYIPLSCSFFFVSTYRSIHI